MDDLHAAYEAILPLVERPARYLGGERGAVHKDPTVETAMHKKGTLKPHEFIGTLLGLSAEKIKGLRVTKTETLFHQEGGHIPAVETAEPFLPASLR